MTHLDLFSGIGGFAYAVDQVWDNVEHIFCDNDPFCQKVLAKHWPESEIYDDIRAIITDTDSSGLQEVRTKQQAAGSWRGRSIDILTGGFPCQPFSQAGKKRGTADNRYLWPEMLRVIKLTRPKWVIAENVYGLINWNNGMVFKQVYSDLEASGYEVQAFVIPALAVNAPHKRDRVWFVAHAKHLRRHKAKNLREDSGTQPESPTRPELPVHEPTGVNSLRTSQFGRDGWDTDWFTVATRVCRVDDGISDRVDRIKALGNAIVPQVAIEIMKGMALL